MPTDNQRQLDNSDYRTPWTIRVGYWLGAGALLGLFAAARWVSGQDHITLNYLLVIGGGVLGWCVGILLSPYGEKEKREFSEYTKAASTFVTGYVLAKADRMFDQLFASGGTGSVFLGRLILFATSFFLLGLFAFVARRYVGAPRQG